MFHSCLRMSIPATFVVGLLGVGLHVNAADPAGTCAAPDTVFDCTVPDKCATVALCIDCCTTFGPSRLQCAISCAKTCVDGLNAGSLCTQNSDCDSNTCQFVDSTGACCSGTECVVTTEAACLAVPGIYQGDGTPCGPGGECIPTLSEWGLLAMTLLVLCAGTVAVRRRAAVLRN